jgi:hypothetical protein
MTIRERVLYHQVHPLTLTADAAAIVAGAVLLWQQHLLRAMAIGLGLPIAASVIVIQFANVERLAQSRSGHYVARYMTRWTVVARVIGVFIAWEGAWYRSAFWCGVGMLVVALVWARGALGGHALRFSRPRRLHPLSITAPWWATDVITVGLLLATIANVVVCYLAGHSFRAYVIENSDLLYLPALFSDVFGKGGRLSDWFLTPAPYFFPDYLLYFLAYVLGVGTYIRIAIFAVVQIGATLCVMWLLTRRLSPSHAFVAAVTITIALVWLALRASEPFVILLASASHYGTFLSSILFAALWIQYESSSASREKRLLLVAICILVFLATLSDNLFVVQADLPFAATVIATLVTRRARSTRREIFGPVLAAVSIALAMVVPVLTYRTPIPPPSINVAWAGGVDDQQRAALEARFHLTDGDSRGGGLWTYRISDTTTANVAALVRHPGVVDTQHIDRQSFTVDGAQGPLRRAVSTVPIGLVLSTFLALCWVFVRDIVRHRGKRGVWTVEMSALVPVLFSALGFISYNFLVANPTRYPPSIGLEKIYGNLTDLSVGIGRSMTATPAFGISVVAYVGMMLFGLMRPVVTGSDREYPSPLAWLTVFSLSAICSTIVAASFVTDLPVMARYLIPVFLWPVVSVSLLVHHYLGRRFVVVGTAFSLLAIVSLTSVSYRLAASNGVSGRYYPSDMACLDAAIEREGLHNGIAQYWDAKYLQQFSRLDLNIAQYSDDLAETKWITSLRYFRQRYDFAVLSTSADSTFDISSEDLTKMNGAPRQIVGCGSKVLYIYGRDRLRTTSSIAGQRPSDRARASMTVQTAHAFRSAKENVPVG